MAGSLFNIGSFQLLPVYLADISLTCEFKRAMVEPVKEACTTKDATCPMNALVCVKRETILPRRKPWNVREGCYLAMSFFRGKVGDKGVLHCYMFTVLSLQSLKCASKGLYPKMASNQYGP